MSTKTRLLIFCITAFFIGSIVLAANSRFRLIMDQKFLKVHVSEGFPGDLDCKILVGPDGSPHFHTEGTQERMKAASIDIDLGPSVSVLRKEGVGNPYVLYLFSEDEEGKVIGLFDLNMDGIWDVRKRPTRKQNFISIDCKWIEVTKIDGLLTGTPKAEGHGVRYEFRGSWEVIK